MPLRPRWRFARVARRSLELRKRTSCRPDSALTKSADMAKRPRRRDVLGTVALLGAGSLLAACTPVAAPGAAIPTQPLSTQTGAAQAPTISNTPSGNTRATASVTYGAADEA